MYKIIAVREVQTLSCNYLNKDLVSNAILKTIIRRQDNWEVNHCLTSQRAVYVWQKRKNMRSHTEPACVSAFSQSIYFVETQIVLDIAVNILHSIKLPTYLIDKQYFNIRHWCFRTLGTKMAGLQLIKSLMMLSYAVA